MEMLTSLMGGASESGVMAALQYKMSDHQQAQTIGVQIAADGQAIVR